VILPLDLAKASNVLAEVENLLVLDPPKRGFAVEPCDDLGREDGPRKVPALRRDSG
jgi:hypothetical protein